jgi:hypothetical protein
LLTSTPAWDLFLFARQASDAFTDEQGSDINKLLNEYIPLVKAGSSDLVAKKKAMSAMLGVVGIAEGDLKTLKTNADAFGEALLSKMPVRPR